MSRELRIFVPRLMDAANTNAQNLNARALLSRFTSPKAWWVTTYYDPPDESMRGAPRVELQKLWRTRLWQWHILTKYQQNVDAIFYPGMEWFDAEALTLRRVSRRKIPVIGTLEGLAGDEEREKELERIVGHRVYCHRVGRDVVERCDRILRSCDHIIAITPMLAKVGAALYGRKVSVIPLGIDSRIFHATKPLRGNAFRVIGVGNLKENKRPGVFLQLARRFPQAEFAWYGQGVLLERMRREAADSAVKNVSFPGVLQPEGLAAEYGRSDLFILPSRSEGAPKVLQEAAACCLPRIAFGFYEPAISDSEDGFVVWSDEELFARVGQMISDRSRARHMGASAAAKAGQQDWELVAPLWESKLLELLETPHSG